MFVFLFFLQFFLSFNFLLSNIFHKILLHPCSWLFSFSIFVLLYFLSSSSSLTLKLPFAFFFLYSLVLAPKITTLFLLFVLLLLVLFLPPAARPIHPHPFIITRPFPSPLPDLHCTIHLLISLPLTSTTATTALWPLSTLPLSRRHLHHLHHGHFLPPLNGL